jgi:xylose isomerase
MITDYQKISFTTDVRHIAAADKLAKTLQISINKVFERALSGYIQRKERELNNELGSFYGTKSAEEKKCPRSR